MTRADFEQALIVHRIRSIDVLSEMLAQGLLKSEFLDLDSEDREWIALMGAAAYRSMGESGVDFMFSKDGERWSVVT